MTSNRLPVSGFTYLALAAQDDGTRHRRILATLIKDGFAVRGSELVPPAGATGQSIIAAITAAFQASTQG